MSSQKPVVISKADFFAALKREEKYYDLPGVGTVKIRGMSVAEAQRLYQAHEKSRPDLVVAVVQTCMTDPELTDEDARALYDAKAGPVTKLFEEIMAMSAEATEELQGEVGTGS